MKTHLFRFVLALLVAGAAGRLVAAPALVGHACFQGQSLDADAIKAALLGRKVTIGDTRVLIVIVKASDAQDQFLQQYVGMNTSQFQNHWRRLFMTGGGSAPKIVESEAEASRLVAETTGALAIVEHAQAGRLVVLAAGK